MITYRPAVPEDFDFLFRLHRETMRHYTEAAYGPWDEGWQRDYYQRRSPFGELRIIQWEGEDIGVLYAQERTEEIYIVSLEIMPSFQRRGIGSAVIRDLIEESKRRGKPVALQVLKINVLARNLYQRLGFGVTGENETHYIMAYEHH